MEEGANEGRAMESWEKRFTNNHRDINTNMHYLEHIFHFICIKGKPSHQSYPQRKPNSRILRTGEAVAIKSRCPNTVWQMHWQHVRPIDIS